MQGGQSGACIETVDRFHQIEHRVTQHRGVLAHRDQRRVWDVGICERVQHLGFAQDHRVAHRPQMLRTAAEDVLSAVPGEPKHDVLRSAGDLRDVLDGTATKA